MTGTSERESRSRSPEAEDDYGLPLDYKPYIPVKKRRAQMLSKFGSSALSKKLKTDEQAAAEKEAQRELERALLKERRHKTLLQEAQEVKRRKELEGESDPRCFLTRDAEKSAAQMEAEQEAALLKELERGQKKLAGVQEIAQGKTWTESLKTSWRPPRYIRELSEAEQQAVREKNAIIIEGEDLPPAIEHFAVRSVVVFSDSRT